MADRQTATAGRTALKSDIAALSLSRGYKGLIVSSITWKMLKERCEFTAVYPQPRVTMTRKTDRGFTLAVFVSKWPLSRIPEVTGITGASAYFQGHQKKRVLAYSIHMSAKSEHLVSTSVRNSTETVC